MDPIVVGGLIVGVIGAASAIVSSIAAIYAAKYAKDSPTKQDLARVERNTAATTTQVDAVRARVESHLAEEKRQEQISDQFYRLSIYVTGGGRVVEPLNLHFTLLDPNVTLLRVELINDNKVLSGTVVCVMSQPLVFTASIEPALAIRWFNSAKPLEYTADRSLGFRLFLNLNGEEDYKQYSIRISQGSQQSPGAPATKELIWVLSDIY